MSAALDIRLVSLPGLSAHGVSKSYLIWKEPDGPNVVHRWTGVEHAQLGPRSTESPRHLEGKRAKPIGGGKYQVADAVVTVTPGYASPYGSVERWTVGWPQ